MKKLIIFAILFSFAGLSAQRSTGRIAYINAVVHVGDGNVVEGCLFVVNKDRIETLSEIRGIRLDQRSFDTVIDLAGKHIYPALINSNNVLGLHDAEAVRATVDFREVGALNPHIRSVIAYNTDNAIVPTVRSNGVLYTQVTPRGGLISGSSSLMALEGWNWEDALLKADDGIHVNFPKMHIRRWKEEEGVTKAANKKYSDEMVTLERFFSDAAAYNNSAPSAEKNIRFEAMRAVFNGKANLYLHADKAKDILSAINFAVRHNIKRAVIVGGREAYKVTSELRRTRIPVMLCRLFDLPENDDEDVDIVYRLPYLLQKDSVSYCLQLEGDMEAAQSRNLAFDAGAAVAYGITKEQALASVSSSVARILGVDSLIGTLSEGRLASFVVSEGDLLDMRTSNVSSAFIAGKPVHLANRQTELYLKYKNKYGIK